MNDQRPIDSRTPSTVAGPLRRLSAADMSSGPDRSGGKAASAWFHRLNGFFIIVTSIAMGGLGALILSLLAEDLRKSPDLRQEFPSLAAWLIDSRAMWPVAALPPLVIGIRLAWRAKSMSRGSRWLHLLIAYAILLPLFGVILWTFIMVMAQLYTYHPLD